jgi:3-oxoacyl-[acyl-carrier protein] reductase
MQKVAIVTGAARGLGASIALRLADEGLDIGVLDLDEKRCIEAVDAITEKGRRAVAVSVDVTDEISVRKAVQEVETRLGPPTVLVNNAGVMSSRMSHKMTLEQWDLVINVNLRGSFLMSRETCPYMKDAEWGRIVNISSTGALGLMGGANYSSAKAGVQGLTKTLAIELGKTNVTVNAVAPGFVVTDMTRATADQVGVSVEEMEQEAARDIPVGRAGTTDDIANAVAFFVDERSGFVSGQVLYVAGGPKC